MATKHSVAVEPILKEVSVNAPIAKVWKAITDKDDMKQWYFEIEEFIPETGFEFKFYGGTEEKKYLHLCKITEVIPEKKLSYIWRYDGYPGESLVTFELFAEGTKTKLRLTHEGLETFPADNSDFARENFVAGWNEIIGTSIKKYVEVSEVPGFSLEVKRVVNSSTERVWQAWTNPDELKQWFAPENMSTPAAELDLRIGGAYKIKMSGQDGEHTAVGIFSTVTAPNKLVFSWKWEGSPEPETQIAVELKEIGTGKTEVTLHHTGFVDEKSRDLHNQGWESTFNKMERYF